MLGKPHPGQSCLGLNSVAIECYDLAILEGTYKGARGGTQKKPRGICHYILKC